MTDKINERQVEQKLRDEIKKAGGKAYKFVSPGNTGVPDRIVILPSGKIIFVELKSPGKKPTALQEKQIEILRKLKQDVRIIDSPQRVAEFIEEVVPDDV